MAFNDRLMMMEQGADEAHNSLAIAEPALQRVVMPASESEASGLMSAFNASHQQQLILQLQSLTSGPPTKKLRPAFEELAPASRSAFEELALASRSAFEELAPALRSAFEELAPVSRSAFEELAPALRSAFEELAPASRSVFEELAPTSRSAFEELAPASMVTNENSLQKSQAENITTQVPSLRTSSEVTFTEADLASTAVRLRRKLDDNGKQARGQQFE
jgi:hypothetical protein